MKKKKTKKIKEIRLPMKFNTALMKYEPILPKNKNISNRLTDGIRIDWWLLILFIIFLTIFVYFLVTNI